MDSKQARHMFAAAAMARAAPHLETMHEALGPILGNIPCAPREAALGVARALFRLPEYFECLFGELPLLWEMARRGRLGLDLEANHVLLDRYWTRQRDHLALLGENPDPLLESPQDMRDDLERRWAHESTAFDDEVTALLGDADAVAVNETQRGGER